jgi:hypothetical protein
VTLRSVPTLPIFAGALVASIVASGCSRSERNYETTTAGAEVPPQGYDQSYQRSPGVAPSEQPAQPSEQTMPGNQSDQELYRRTPPGDHGMEPGYESTPPSSPGTLQLTPPSTTPGSSGSTQLTPPGSYPGASGQYAPGQQGGAQGMAPPGAAGPRGEALHTEVHQALERAPNLDSTAIQVAVQGDSVYLSGYVPTPEQRRLAHDVAHSVEGVRHVYTRDLQVR